MDEEFADRRPAERRLQEPHHFQEIDRRVIADIDIVDPPWRRIGMPAHHPGLTT